MSSTRRSIATSLAVLGTAGLLAACAGESRPEAGPASTTTRPASGTAARSGTVVRSGSASASASEAEPESAFAFGPDEATATVALALKEFMVLTPITEVPAGKLFVTATNMGADTHELVLTHAGAADEEGAIAEVDGIAPGETKAIAAELAPGRYQFACYIKQDENGTVEDHYKLGMVHEFDVK